MRINKHDTQGTKPLLGKGELGYDDYVAGGDVGRVYVGTGSENIALAERLESNMMTKAQFNALAEERKTNRAGSGFDEWGKHNTDVNLYPNVNNGIWTYSLGSNYFFIGRETNNASSGGSKVLNPILNINGNRLRFDFLNDTLSRSRIQLPTAPSIYPYDTVLTTEQINSGVIKHADASNSGLIVNGKFDTDTSGWSATNSTLSTVGGKLRVTATSTNGWAQQNIPTVIGKKYIVEFNATAGTASTWVQVASSIPSQITATTQSGYGTIEFIAITTTTYIRMYAYSTSGTYSDYDNIAVYPADAISRSDLVFLESFHEDISEKNFVYPLGNVQYLGGNTDGLTGIINGNFTGFETYSLFGNWQTPSALIGKGYVWSLLTEAQKRAFIANPENNCYLDGDKTIQVRYRVRVIQGLGDNTNSFSTLNTASYLALFEFGTNSMGLINARGKKASTPDTKPYVDRNTTGTYYNLSNSFGESILISSGTPSDVAYEGKCFAMPIALIHRRNQVMYHPVYNPNGTKKASDGNFWYNTAVSFTSISDCFDPSKLLTASGYIGSVSGRPDGLFYDQVHESDILDLRNSSKKPEDYNRFILREFNKLVAGTTRGFEGEKYTEITTQTTTGTVATVQVKDGTRYKRGDVIYIYDLTASSAKGRFTVISISSNTLTVDTAFAKLANSYMISGASSTRTKSNTLLVCDVIGNPANYPTAWKQNECSFTTLHTAEDGTSLLPDGIKDAFKLSRDANVTPLLCLRSTDSGATWTSFTPTFSTTTNEITLTNEPANNLVMVYYQTKTSMAVPVVNSEVLEIGDVYASQNNATSNISFSLIGKILTGSGGIGQSYSPLTKKQTYLWSPFKFDDAYRPQHDLISIDLATSSAVKVFPYLTRTNGKAYLNLVFKEMKHNGTSWGDDAKFNIVDNVSTTTDNNAQTVLIGQKTVELPYFIAGDE